MTENTHSKSNANVRRDAQNYIVTNQNVSLHYNAYYASYRHEDLPRALESREANGFAELPRLSERRAAAVVELMTAWKAPQNRKDVLQESNVVVRLERRVIHMGFPFVG